MLFQLSVILLHSCLSGKRKCLQVHLYTHAHRHVEILRKKELYSGHILFKTEYSDMRTHLGIYSSFSYTQQSCMHDTFLHMRLTHTFFPHHTSKFLIQESLCSKPVQVVKNGKKNNLAYSNFCVKSVSFHI